MDEVYLSHYMVIVDPDYEKIGLSLGSLLAFRISTGPGLEGAYRPRAFYQIRRSLSKSGLYCPRSYYRDYFQHSDQLE
jgi:hypothetical protein